MNPSGAITRYNVCGRTSENGDGYCQSESRSGEGTKIFVEKYFALVRKDIEDASTALQEPMPKQLRDGLESELKRLQMLNSALEGELDKSTLHQLRANLRWARKKLDELDKDADLNTRKKMAKEIANIEAEIKKEVERVWERK